MDGKARRRRSLSNSNKQLQPALYDIIDIHAAMCCTAAYTQNNAPIATGDISTPIFGFGAG